MLINIEAGIYSIQNKSSIHRYLGSSVNMAGRKNGHWTDLQKGIHTASHLQNAWNKYGSDAVSFVVLEVIKLTDEELIALKRVSNWHDYPMDEETRKLVTRQLRNKLLDIEQSYIDNHLLNHPRETLYNSRITVTSRLGSSDKSKRQKSVRKPTSEETKVKIATGNRGRIHSAESKEKMRQRKLQNPTRYWLGKERNPETIHKISESKRGRPSGRKGCRMSDKTKQKISISKMGSIPWNKKMSIT